MTALCEAYNRWREWCGLKRAKTFDDLVDIPADTIDQYRQLYEYVFLYMPFI